MKETKLEFSIGIWMSHKLAADETAASNYEFITPVHLFCGLTKLEDTLNPMLLPKLGLPTHRIPTYEAEVTQLLNLFQKFKIKPKEVRHIIRELIGDDGYQRENQELISRSSTSCQVFERAGEIAQTAKASEIAVHHLLAAICEIEKEHFPQLFNELQANISELYVEIQLKSIEENLARQGVRLDIQDEIIQWLIKQWYEEYDPQPDNRSLQSLIFEDLSDKINKLIQSNKLRESYVACIRLEQDELQVYPLGDETLD
jgi:ATP-dependent Clp protease ATP-binding subunit ClpA